VVNWNQVNAWYEDALQGKARQAAASVPCGGLSPLMRQQALLAIFSNRASNYVVL
jgi:hypothetical protein